VPKVQTDAQLPPELDYVWEMFEEISMGLQGSGFGIPVITWRDLSAWKENTGTPLEPWEAKALVILGNLRAFVTGQKVAGK